MDARLLAQLVLGWDAASFLANAHEAPPAPFSARYDALIARRAAREPMAYLAGAQEFWGLLFEVAPGVLIPRPETELIVQAALERFPNPQARFEVADVGTGSGCLAIAIAHERRNARVLAIDIADAAGVLVARNARRHGVEDRVAFSAGDLLDGAPGRTSFDLIVSNPPYVPERERATVQPEVREYEPPVALFGGEDGLSIIRRLLQEAPPRLEPDGWLIFEIGAGQAENISQIIADQSLLALVEIKPDLQGIPRTIVARRH